MAKYGKDDERESRREEKRQLAALEKTVQWTPEPGRETSETVEKAMVGPRSRDQVAQRVVKYRGTNSIVEFAVTYSRRGSNDTWQEVLCIDTCHYGTVHRHRDGDHSSEPEHISHIASQSILHEAFWDAIDEAYDAVEWG